MKISINVPDNLVARIEEYAEKHCLSRSAAISYAVSDWLDTRQALESMPDMLDKLKTMQEIAEKMGYDNFKKAVSGKK